ncbi:alpha/beta hydrolase [Shewanella putrefaciens]|uniref:alpha/beta hydrolase n=1 Tax=Shewanella putrefaciens TaxID=24 RepID=UPI0002DCBA3A|nr:alpha/beta hydrolase [Shewanella putrefaciens]UXK09954.1 alpha/beta hydrolase [Shewanella putrefaciens]
MNFDAATNMDLINQPLLMVAGSKADSLYMTKEVFELATEVESKQLFLIEGATHIETYWKPEYVEQAITQFADFFANTLK